MVKKNQPEEAEENGTGSEEEEEGAVKEVDSDESESDSPKSGDKTKPTVLQKGTDQSKPKRQTEKNDGKGQKVNKKNNVTLQKDIYKQLDDEGTSDDDDLMEGESTDDDLTEEESSDSGDN